MTIRDEKFLGFARALWVEIEVQATKNDGFIEVWDAAKDVVETLIAQRAYDLVCHVIEHAKGDIIDNTEPYVKYNIPDLTEWPQDNG